MAQQTRPSQVTLAAACLVLLIASARAGEQQQGADLAATCASCHGPAGSAQGIPSLAGLDESSILSAMAAYRASERPNYIMHAVALSLSDEELKLVARYLAQHPTEAKPK